MGDCGSVEISKPYPNPVWSGFVKVNLSSLCAKQVKWAVVTAGYRKIGEWDVEVSGRKMIQWDLTDSKGQRVAAGLYYMVITPQGQKLQVLPVIVLR